MKDKLKEAIRTIVSLAGTCAIGALVAMVLIYLHDNSRIMQILVSDFQRITAPLLIFQPVVDFIAWAILALVALVLGGGTLLVILLAIIDRLIDPIRPWYKRKYGRRKAARAAKHKRAPKAERQDKPPALDKAPPAAKFNRAMVYRNGQWMTRSEAERQDKHKRAPVKRIYQSQHRSEAARQALTPDEWRRFEAFKPSEWHRLGDLRAAVIDGSMGVDEARRLLAGGYGWPPVARPFAKREPVKDGSMDRDDARRLLSIFVRSADLPRQQALRKIAMELPLSKIVEWAENGSLNKREAGLLLRVKQGWTASDVYSLMTKGNVFWHEGLLPECPMFGTKSTWYKSPTR